ncbi:C2 and GRAM domain-containing protein At5g50170-like [Chenopodium quinoa]|nr:C2 and GRAM domain-containing protein At5g50170-like [Chenopodium quinoa]
MRLYAYVLEAKDLPVKNSSYVKLQVGKFKSKTRIVSGSDPVWNEEFVFRVHDLEDELVLSIYHHDEDDSYARFFNVSGFLVGRVRVPVWTVVGEESECLPPTWFSLQNPKAGKRMKKNVGKILLTLTLHGRGDVANADLSLSEQSCTRTSNGKEEDFPDHGSVNSSSPKAPPLKVPHGKKMMKAVTKHLDKLLHKNGEPSKSDESSDFSVSPSEYEACVQDESLPSSSFEESLDMMQSRDEELEMPENLQGGILLDQTYVVTSKDLNAFLFAPDSQFRRELSELQGTTDIQESPWTCKSGDSTRLSRLVTYINPASKLCKAVKATEEQTYVKADGAEFAVFVSIATPDVPYGNTFKVELLYKIMPGPELSSGEESSRLLISWGINFSQSTLMKGMIENGAKQGLKESFDHFSRLLAQKFKVLDSEDSSEKDHVLEALEREHQSDWELATEYFGNLTVVAAIFLTLYVVVHILISVPHEPQGLEINGLILPDSFGQLITCGVLVLLLERVYNMVSLFVQARLRVGNDHGIKSQGDGWKVTVALVEAVNLPSLDTAEPSDPFVVFTCNGKTRTSSVQLQTCDPQWNEILEFDASEELPSVLDVEVFDFGGPFDQTASLGHTEINFLKHSAAELADMWVPLEGKAVSSQAKLHLRIFVENKKGVETVKGYLNKMEKEVGKKLNLRSPHKNSSFQKLFGLPPEEFLIKDYSCSLRRKMPLQGRLFLSARIVGFYSNFFGHKTKFFFLWEDIEDIEVQDPTMSSFGSPTLIIILRKGRGIDARHGARTQDEEGRLKFYFQSFIPFEVASKTITALWRSRTAALERKALGTEEDQGNQESLLVPLENDNHFHVEESNMLKIYSSTLPVDIKSLMKMFGGGNLERKVMAKSGCLNYVTTEWQSVKPDVYERQLSYKFNHIVSVFGGEVRCSQRKSFLGDTGGWIVNEAMALHDIPFGDHFRVHLSYHLESLPSTKDACKCEVYMGILWLKDCKFQQRIVKNINEKFSCRLKSIFELVKKEILLANEHSV